MRKNLYNSVDTPVKELATLVYHHFGKAPMGWTGIDKLTEYAHNEQFVERVFDLYAIAKNSKDLILGINPSQFYKIIYKFQLAAKSLDVPVEKIVDCYLYLANYGIQVYNHNCADIEEFVKTAQFIPVVNEAAKKNVSYLSALLRSFSETLYCDEHTIAGEIYSPIPCKDGFMIVRKYAMLNAGELRQELQDFPFEKVDVYVKYSGSGDDAQTDIVGNLLTNRNLIETMQSYYIEGTKKDGQVVAICEQEKIEELIAIFKKTILELVRNYKKMPLIDRLWKKVECEYYALKPFFQSVGRDWSPVRYDIDIDKIASESRLIVKLNNEIALLQDEKEIQKQLFILNDPRKHEKR